MRAPHCDPLLTLRAAVFRSVALSRGRSRRFHDVRNEAAYPSAVPDLRRSTPNGFQRAPSFSALSTPGMGGTRPLILEADCRWSAPATACSSWSGAVPERHAAGNENSNLVGCLTGNALPAHLRCAYLHRT